MENLFPAGLGGILLPQFRKIGWGFMQARPDPAIELDDLIQEGAIMVHALIASGRIPAQGRDAVGFMVVSYRRLLQSIYGRASKGKRVPEGGFVRDNDETIMSAVDRYGYRNTLTRAFISEVVELLTALDAKVLSELILAQESAPEVIASIEAGRGARLTAPMLARVFTVSEGAIAHSIARIRRVVSAEFAVQ